MKWEGVRHRNDMARVLIHVEGQTEETFVNEVLGPYLSGIGFTSVSARIVGSARQRSGICGWQSASKGIVEPSENRLRGEHDGGLLRATEGKRWLAGEGYGEGIGTAKGSDGRSRDADGHCSEDGEKLPTGAVCALCGSPRI